MLKMGLYCFGLWTLITYEGLDETEEAKPMEMPLHENIRGEEYYQ